MYLWTLKTVKFKDKGFTLKVEYGLYHSLPTMISFIVFPCTHVICCIPITSYKFPDPLSVSSSAASLTVPFVFKLSPAPNFHITVERNHDMSSFHWNDLQLCHLPATHMICSLWLSETIVCVYMYGAVCYSLSVHLLMRTWTESIAQLSWIVIINRTVYPTSPEWVPHLSLSGYKLRSNTADSHDTFLL